MLDLHKYANETIRQSYESRVILAKNVPELKGYIDNMTKLCYNGNLIELN